MELLRFAQNSINDDTLSAFAEALTVNNKLKELNLGRQIHENKTVTHNGYAAFTNILCNKESILHTYHSNHTLQNILCKYSLFEDVTPS